MAETIRVQVIFSPAPRDVREWTGEMPAGSTAIAAVEASGFAVELHALAAGHLGIWGRKCAPGRALRDGDRVEVYRPLVVDPKVARRERFRKQGIKTAGLFAQRRAGAKPGY